MASSNREYHEWCRLMELTYDVMPQWYWYESKRLKVFLSQQERRDLAETNV